MQYPTLWFWRSAELVNGWRAVESYTTDEHPKPYRFDGGLRPTDAPTWSSLTHNGEHLVATVDHSHLPKAPPLWYVVLDQTQTLGDATALMAFADDRFPDGTVLSVEQFRACQVEGKKQIGAVQWMRNTGTLTNLRVNEAYRRRGISLKLIHVADVLLVSRDDGFLNGGDHLTSDGEALAAKWQHSVRLKPQVGRYSPMD